MPAINMFQVVRNNDTDTFLSALGKFDINQVNEDGQNLLHEAIAFGNIFFAEKLIAMMIDVNCIDAKTQTPLHFAANFRAQAIAEAILRNGGNLDIEDRYGNQALWPAVFNARGDYGLVLQFLKHRLDVNYKNKAGRSPLDFARQIGDKKLIDLLENARD